MLKTKDLFAKLKYRERILCFIAISCLGFFFAKLLILDQIQDIVQYRQRSENIKNELQHAKNNLNHILQTKTPDVKKDPLWEYRNQNLGLASFMKVIGEVDTNREDLTVRKVASEKQEFSNDYEKTTLQMEIDTPFNSLGRLLEEIEESKILARVEKIQIMRIENELRLCRARVLLNTYSWRNP